MLRARNQVVTHAGGQAEVVPVAVGDHQLAMLSNFGPGVLANFGPPPVP
jgi:hypothetical protein